MEGFQWKRQISGHAQLSRKPKRLETVWAALIGLHVVRVAVLQHLQVIQISGREPAETSLKTPG